PVLEGDKTVTLPEDSSIALNIQEPTDAEGDPISVFITQVPGSGTVRKANGDVVNSGEFVSTTELSGLTFEGAPDFFGDAGDLVYTVFEQGTANSQERTVSLNVTNVNDAPVVAPITRTASEDDAPGAIDLTAGQTDVDNDALTAQNVQQTGGPNNVAFTISGNNITIDPGQFNNLPDGEEVVLEFTYDVNDGTTSVSNTLTLTVTGENDAPETDLINVLSNEDAAKLQIDLLDGQTDPDDNETPLLTVSDLSVSLDTGANPVVFETVGDFLLVDPAQYNYLAAGENVILTFDYNVNDAATSTANAVNITINGINDAPDASAHADDTDEDAGIYSIDLAPLQSDPDTSNSLTISGLTRTDGRSVSHSFVGTTLSFDTNLFSDLPEGTSEDVVFEYDVSDGTTTVTRTLTITVEGREDAVTIVPNQSADVEENSPVDTVVGTVQIIDDDDPTPHTFEIFGGIHKDAFAIDSATGEITVVDASILDFESLESTDLLIRVTDAGGNEDEEAFTVNITDVNEAPTLTHETISVLAKDLPFQMPMVRFGLEDPDAGEVLSLIVTSAIARDTGGNPKPDADVTDLFENDDSVSVREDRNDFTDDEALVTTNAAYLLLDPGSVNDGTLEDDIEFGKRDRVTNADVIDLTVELSDSSGETKVETLTFDLLSPLLVGDADSTGTGGNDYLVGNLAAQTMRGGGDDDILIGARIDPTALGYNPNNPLGLFEEGDQLFGGGGNDLLFARYGQSHLNGGGGNDILYSDGGAGDMRFTPGTGNNAIFAHSSGLNILDYSAALPDGTRVIVDFDTGIALQEFEVTPDVFELRNTDETFGDAGKSGINAFYGTNSDDIVKGSTGHMRVALNRGLETFAPMPYTPDTAIEVIAPNGGDDIIDGGDAFSILSYMGVAVGGATVNAGVNVNFVTGVAVDPLSGVDNFTGIEGVIGTAFDDVLIGDENGQVFEGGQGDDDIRGGSGLDENGLENVDVVRFEHILSEDMGHFTSITGTEFANVIDGIALEIFSVIDRVYTDGHGDVDDIRGIERYIGTGLRDEVRVSAGEKIISFYGLGGDDFVRALDGDFEFFAGPGDDGFEGRGTSDDLVFGMQGEDVLLGGDGADVLVGGFGREAIIFGGDENDLIFASGSALAIPTLGALVDDLATTTVDESEDDYANPSVTFDFTNGLQGVNTFVNDFVARANDPAGAALAPSVRFRMPDELVDEAPHPTLAGRADLGADGLALQTLDGGDGNDMLVGSALGRDQLFGGLGDNVLHGGAPISYNLVGYGAVALENNLGIVLDLDGIFFDANSDVLFHALDRNFNPFALGNIAGVRDQIFFANGVIGTANDDILIGKDGMYEVLDPNVEGYQIGTSTYGPTFLIYDGANQEIFNPEFFIGSAGNDLIDGDGRDFDADDFANGTTGEDIRDADDGTTGFDAYLGFLNGGTFYLGVDNVNNNGTPGDTSDDFQKDAPIAAISAIGSVNNGTDLIIDVEMILGSSETDRFRGDQHDNFFYGGDGVDNFLEGGSLLVDDGMGGQVLDLYADMDFLVFDPSAFWPADFPVSGPSNGININIATMTITDDGFGNTESTSDDFRGILATNHNDTITGTNAAGSEIHGFGGNDLIIGGQFDDVILGGDGNDTIGGADGDDELRGDDGNDFLEAGIGDDTLSGGAGNDVLLGDAGSDVLLGGAGSDTLRGGLGDGADDLMLDFSDGIDVNTYVVDINSGAADDAADSWTHINGADQIGTNDPLAAELEDLLGSATAQFAVGQDVLQFIDLSSATSRIDSEADFVAEYDTFSLLNARWFASVDGAAGNVINVSFGGESALTIVLDQDVDTSLYGNNGNFNDGDAFITALGGSGSIDFI
ncbi:MAG: cadherin domain-containing protein, partial [Alphaproteobacteria bacterium]